MAEHEFMTDEELRARYPELAPPVKPAGKPALADPEKPKANFGRADLSLVPKDASGRMEFAPEPATVVEPKPEEPKPEVATKETTTGDSEFFDSSKYTKSTDDTFFDSSRYTGKGKANRWGVFKTTSETQPFQQTIFNTEIVRVIDGDSFVAKVMINGTPQEVRIRLRGADAPEMGLGGLGAKERDALKGILSKGPVVVVNPRFDPESGRYEADVRTNQVSDVSHWMKKNGFAQDWLGTPPDWPKDNEWRQLWGSDPRKPGAMSVEDQIKWKEVAAEHRRFGLMRSGKWGYKERPTKEQLAAFQKLADQFMREYVRPWRQKMGRWQAPVTQSPSTSSNPMDRALDQALGPGGGGGPQQPPKPFDPRDVKFEFDRPSGHGEHSSWFRSLHPHPKPGQQLSERAIFSILKRKDEEFKRNAPRGWDDRAAYMRSPEYVSFKKYYEKFMDLTTKRWRKHREQLDQQYKNRNRGGGMRGNRGIIRLGDLSPGQRMVPMAQAKDAIASMESGGRYGVVGVPTRLGRALGKYQVMQANLPSWLQRSGLPPMPAQAFLRNPQAQERVFETIFGGLMKTYGNFNDAASVWFSGKPTRQAGNRQDAHGTTVPKYLAVTNARLRRTAANSAVEQSPLSG